MCSTSTTVTFYSRWLRSRILPDISAPKHMQKVEYYMRPFSYILEPFSFFRSFVCSPPLHVLNFLRFKGIDVPPPPLFLLHLLPPYVFFSSSFSSSLSFYSPHTICNLPPCHSLSIHLSLAMYSPVTHYVSPP